MTTVTGSVQVGSTTFPVTASITLPAVSNRVTRSGTQLMLNGKPWRMVGFNIWGTAVNSTWNHPANGGAPSVNDGTTLQTWLTHIRATAPKVNTIRSWFLQQFAMNNGVRDWSAFDKVLSVCDSNGFKIIASLEDNWSYERTGSQQPALPSSWFSGGYTNTVLTHEGIPYRAWVQEIVTHYAGDARIVLWEPGNELNGATTAFMSDISGLIKSIDPGALFGDGGVGVNSAMMALSGMDMGSYHYYTDYSQTDWQTTQSVCASAGKPWYMGEMGNSGSGTTRSSAVNSLMSSCFADANTAGFVYWQYSDGGGDQFKVASGDPVLPVVNSYVL